MRMALAERLARTLGVAAALAVVILLAVLLFANPYSDQGIGAVTYAIMALMAALAGLAGWSAWKGHPLGLIAAFALSFFPVGLYLLGTPGVFRWIGAADVLYLAGGVLLWIARRAPERDSA
jgi:hypothetical protein